jgi:hypothetical protein
MSDGVVVMVDGRTKVLQKVAHRDDRMIRQLLDHRPDLVLGSAAVDDHRRLLLVSRRETATRTPGSSIASLERVYVDSDAVPLLVGLQVATHVRPREVLLRLLDHVALELPHWRGGRLRELARLTNGDRDEAELLGTVGWQADPETYWARVDAHLARDRVRIVLLADRLPDDLARTVEFLDGQLREVEVRAVEVARYGSGPVCAVVPRSTRVGSVGQRAPHVARPAGTAVGGQGRHALPD